MIFESHDPKDSLVLLWSSIDRPEDCQGDPNCDRLSFPCLIIFQTK